MIKKIISGGQTGADRAALDVALKYNIPHGGWIPKGRKAEDGTLPEIYRLKEMPTASYPKRTEQNVMDSDGTLIVARGKLTGGTDLTRKMTLKHKKQLLGIDLNLTSHFDAASLTASWIKLQRVKILNVAGPRASKDPIIYSDAFKILEQAIQILNDEQSKDWHQKMRQPKYNLNTVNAVIDDIIAEMPLDDRVKTANLDEDGLLVLQLGLGKYLQYLIDHQSENVNEKLLTDCIKQSGDETLGKAEAALYILKELWNRLQRSHRLRVVK